MHRTLGFGPLALLSALLLVAWNATPAQAQEENDYPAFLIISLSETFEAPDVSLHCQSSKDGGCHDNRCGCKKRKRHDKKQCECTLPEGSGLVLVPVGFFIAGFDVRNTFFTSAGTVTSDALAAAIAALGDIELLNGNQATIVGAVDTLGPNSIHLLTPDPGTVPPEVQEAFFWASPYLEALPPELYPRTTVELGEFVYNNQAPPERVPPPSWEELATLQQILDYLFLTEGTLECTTCEAEVDMFPHDPEPDNPLLTQSIRFNENGEVLVEGCTIVAIDVKPGNDMSIDPINLGSHGETPLVILSSVGQRYVDGVLTNLVFFDPREVDPSTVRLGAAHDHGTTVTWTGAAPNKSSYEDKNGDGVPDLILHFYTDDLADPDLGGLTEDTTEVELHGETYENGCIEGTDTVRVVPE